MPSSKNSKNFGRITLPLLSSKKQVVKYLPKPLQQEIRHLEPAEELNPANYFGDGARQDFFERQHWLQQNKDKETSSNVKMTSIVCKKTMKPRQLQPLQTPLEKSTTFLTMSVDDFGDGDPNGSKNDIDAKKINENEIINITGNLHQLDEESMEDLLKEIPIRSVSPRSQFILDCISDGLCARPSLILRKNYNEGINLKHIGMGDKFGRHFALALKGLPNMIKINISDNNLTDKSLCPIIASILELKTVKHLNISDNIVGHKSTKILAKFLSIPQCVLEVLILRNIQLGDEDCNDIVEAVSTSNYLKYVDLSNNFIGQSETIKQSGQKHIHKRLETGATSFGKWLMNPECKLEVLHLSWNMIRLQGAISITHSLQFNKCLIDLDLGYNSINREGGETLGKILLTNNTIKRLNLVRNNLTSSAIFTLCVGIEENSSLTYVNLDENPVGVGGSKVLMPLAASVGHRVDIRANRCNFTIRENADKYVDITNPIGSYVLDCSKSYDRAIVIKLLTIVATHSELDILKFEHFPSLSGFTGGITGSMPSTSGVIIPLFLCTISNPNLSVAQEKLVLQLKRIEDVVCDLDLVNDLFNSYDVDGSGEISKLELKKLLQHLFHLETKSIYENTNLSEKNLSGISKDISSSNDNQGGLSLHHNPFKVVASDDLCSNCGSEESFDFFGNVDLLNEAKNDEDIAQQLSLLNEMLNGQFDTIDEDLSGAIDRNEFLRFFEKLKSYTQGRILELEKISFMSSSPCSSTKYFPPEKGVVRISIDLTNRIRKEQCKILTSLDMANIIKSVGCGTENIVERLKYGICNYKLRLTEALLVYRLMIQEVFDIAKVLSILIPLMKDPAEMKWLIAKKIRNHETEYLRLASASMLGNALNPLTGRFDGFYYLDFSKETDRLCMRLLVTQNTFMRDKHIAEMKLATKERGCGGIAGDTSQHGNWSCFRNEVILESFNGYAATSAVVPNSVDTSTCTREILDSNMFSPVPLEGKVCFDFFGCDKPHMGVSCINDDTCIDLLLKIELLKPSNLSPNDNEESNTAIGTVDARSTLDALKIESTAVLTKALGSKTNPETSKIKKQYSESIKKEMRNCYFVGYYTNKFYSRISQRHLELKHSEYREGHKGCSEDQVLSQDSDDENEALYIHSNPEAPNESDEVIYEIFGSASVDYVSVKESASSTMNSENNQTNTTVAGSTPTSSKRKAQIFAGSSVEDAPKVLHRELLENFTRLSSESINIRQSLQSTNVISSSDVRLLKSRIEVTFFRFWIRARHLHLIIKYYCAGVKYKTIHYGTYRVEIFVSLYHRVVDKYNIDQVLKLFSPFELATIYCRIGYLNLVCPLKPKGYYRLNLMNREEREVAKILTLLSSECGKQTINQHFRHKYNDADLPNRVFPESWLNEKNFPSHGIMMLQFDSVTPNYDFRKALLPLVNMNEFSLFDDEDVASGALKHKPNIPDTDVTAEIEEGTIHHECGKRAFANNNFHTLWVELMATAYSKSHLFAFDHSLKAE